jgi:hypothetical protein
MESRYSKRGSKTGYMLNFPSIYWYTGIPMHEHARFAVSLVVTLPINPTITIPTLLFPPKTLIPTVCLMTPSLVPSSLVGGEKIAW